MSTHSEPRDGVVVLVGTRKGAFFLRHDRGDWKIEGPHFLGQIVQHVVQDPRDGRTLLVAASTGHLGPTVFRSDDLGKSWKEASRPPAFPASDPLARSVKQTFWLELGPTDQPDVWYAGVSPPALPIMMRMVE